MYVNVHINMYVYKNKEENVHMYVYKNKEENIHMDVFLFYCPNLCAVGKCMRELNMLSNTTTHLNASMTTHENKRKQEHVRVCENSWFSPLKNELKNAKKR
jgi:hypothetical protein